MLDEQPKVQKYLTLKQVAEVYQIYTCAGLRQLIDNSDKNGFEKCVRRISQRKILINTEEFEKWIESHKK